MRAVASIALIVLAACDYTAGRAREVDAPMVDMPPPVERAYVESVTVTGTTTIRPGRYGIEVTAVLVNDFAVDITNVAVTLDVGGRDTEFRWRSADRRENIAMEPVTTIPARGRAQYHFVLDALPWLTAKDLQLNAAATFTRDGTMQAAEPLAMPVTLGYTGINAPIVVNFAGDERDSDSDLSLREAMERAATNPGPDRIVFDPARFPAGTVVTLSQGLGELPTITSDLVIDGTGASVTIAVSSSWENPEGRYGLRIMMGEVAIAGITFRDFGFGYRNENIQNAAGNCGASMMQLEGGAIRINAGTVVLDSNRFEDPNVAERNCYAASVRIHGGFRHRIVGNTWTAQSMDALYIAAPVVEISNNVLITPSNPERNDEGIYIAGTGPLDTWIVGNLIVDNEYSAVRSGGNDGGRLFIVNNTFVRNGRSGTLSAVRREGGAKETILRNNLYVGNQPAGILVDNNGVAFDIAHETVTGSMLCNAGNCGSSALVDMASIAMPSDPGVANMNGSTRADFTPTATSPLVDAATPWLDRNGPAPGWFNGGGPERGAIERP